tara:strand:- start:203 stop:712 length:510 start_codon:yes stop_codon:yes gene_type:complete
MEENQDNKLEFKRKLIDFYNLNKSKIFIFAIFLLIILISTIFFKYNNERKNIRIAEKYMKAGIFLSSNQKDNAKVLYEEIILSKNKFYSILALNTIIEKEIIENDEIVLNYFKILEDINYSEEKLDLIIFKKALYLLKSSKNQEGKKLLNNLIEKDSKLKFLAKEAINN